MSGMSRDDARRDLVLAAAQGYTWESLRPFVESLAATGFAGEIRFFVGRVDPATDERLRAAGVALSRPRRLRIELPGHSFAPYTPRTTRVRWRLQPLYRHLARGAAALARDRRAALLALSGALANVEVARYFWYRRHLARAQGRYRNVMLTDVRDVLFLGSPFDYEIGDSVHCFLEDGHFALGTQVNNRGWLVGAYGPDALRELARRPISCSGVTIGAADAVLEYLDVMVDHLARLPRQFKGMDQGVHNYVLHKGLVPRARLVANGEGPVLTVGLMDASRAADALRAAGDSVKVLHQYDRHPGLREASGRAGV